MASLSLKHVFKVYDGGRGEGTVAVEDFSMDIRDREFIVFVGPSGCGKSTTLRMIAGLEDITAGEVSIDGRVVNDCEPRDRDIAMVFQNYALYPHMTVYDNMAFSLKIAHESKEDIRRKVTEAAELLGITEYLSRKPRALSGGQRQRVALGRAIVRHPKVFLLDEPLSNLDAKLRAAMRTEISRLHERLGTTFIYVTHDQVEAMTMGSRIVVMKGGKIQQIDPPRRLYRHPENLFVAGFIGTPQMNFFDTTATLAGDEVVLTLACGTTITVPRTHLSRVPAGVLDGTHPLVLGVRPDDIRPVAEADAPPAEASVRLPATVGVIEHLGGEMLVYAALSPAGEDDPAARVTLRAAPDDRLARGDNITLAIDLRRIHLFDRVTEQNLCRAIPRSCTIPCQVTETALRFEGQTFPLPPALQGHSAPQAELTIPPAGVILGQGPGKAAVVSREEVEDQTLVTLRVGSTLLFSLGDSPALGAGQTTVPFDLDPRAMSVTACGIAPPPAHCPLAARLTKQKAAMGGGKYDFYLELGGGRLLLPDHICQRLFHSRGTAIFRTELVCLIPPEAVEICPSGEGLAAKGERVLDYGVARYGKVRLVATGEELLIALAPAGELPLEFGIKIDVENIHIKDGKLDMMMV